MCEYLHQEKQEQRRQAEQQALLQKPQDSLLGDPSYDKPQAAGVMGPVGMRPRGPQMFHGGPQPRMPGPMDQPPRYVRVNYFTSCNLIIVIHHLV